MTSRAASAGRESPSGAGRRARGPGGVGSRGLGLLLTATVACGEDPAPTEPAPAGDAGAVAPPTAAPEPPRVRPAPPSSALTVPPSEAELPTGDDGLGCPAGMVRVRGEGTIGLTEAHYAVVETAHLRVVDRPERSCPGAVAAHPAPVACWVQTDLTDPVVPPRRVAVDVCIDQEPFPGAGVPYTTDGMTPWDAQHLQELLATGAYGTRRLCTFSEFQAAVAGLSGNRPILYGARHQPERCGAETGPIAAKPGCRSPETGVADYAAVLSHWVVADAAFVAGACPEPPCLGAGNQPLSEGHFVVAGGTGRLQTRQAPLTPHTWHDHGQPDPAGCDVLGHDDQPVICATPDARYRAPDPAAVPGEAAWAALVALARRTGSMTAVLEEGLGRSVCAEGAAGP